MDAHPFLSTSGLRAPKTGIMALGDKLNEWQAAGLIDAAAAARIQAHEDAHAPPVWLWAVAGLGFLALALGIVAVIGSNWDAIPAAVKLGTHFLLMVGAAVAAWIGMRRRRRWLGEGALFLLACLSLGGLALQAQIYQLSGEIWRLLMTWLALAGPALLLAGRTRLTAFGFSGMAIWAMASCAAAMDGSSASERLIQGVAMAAPWLLVAIGAFYTARRPFGGGLTEAGLVVILPAVSLAHLAWAGTVTGGDAGQMLVRMIPVAAAAALALWLVVRFERLPRDIAVSLLSGPAIALALAICIPHGDDWPSRLVGALIYGAMWAAVGYTAARAGYRLLFGVAVGAVAVRLFIVYFELFGSLAMTGLGLIAAGVLLILLAYASRRLLREVPA